MVVQQPAQIHGMPRLQRQPDSHPAAPEMPIMKYDVKIDSQLFETYKEIHLGLMRFHADVKEPREDFWAHMDTDVLPQVRTDINGKEWSKIQGIRGSRAAYKAFGRNPGRYRVSSEALLRRVRRGDDLYHINSVVDVNNLISVESGLSAGSYDLNCIQGSVTLRRAGKGEGYTGIGKDFLDMENMLALADDKGIFGSSMSDSSRAMVTEQTKDILVVIYCFENTIDLQALLQKAQSVFQKYADAQDIEAWII